MGNRALIATEQKDIELYLHWNGGRDSVEAFLLYCKMQGFRSPENDGYGWARLSQVIGNFFCSTNIKEKIKEGHVKTLIDRTMYVGLSIGIMKFDDMSAEGCDNGRYIIKNWEIINREYNGDEQYDHKIESMLMGVDIAQPKNLRLGKAVMKRFLDMSMKLGRTPKLYEVPMTLANKKDAKEQTKRYETPNRNVIGISLQ